MGDGEDVRDLIPDDSRIRLMQLEGGDPLSIGEKRNFGCERAAGSVIIHFDDDDYSAPHRTQNQITRLVTSKLAVTGYRSMMFTTVDGKRYLYSGAADYALGTSLCYRKEWWQANQFPALQIAEDNAFVRRAANAGQFTATHSCGLLMATIHPGNTSPRNMNSAWKEL